MGVLSTLQQRPRHPVSLLAPPAMQSVGYVEGCGGRMMPGRVGLELKPGNRGLEWAWLGLDLGDPVPPPSPPDQHVFSVQTASSRGLGQG